MDWYYGLNNQQYGPVTEEHLLELISNGTLSQTTLIWREGMGEWKPAIEVLNLSTSGTESKPAAVPTAQTKSPYSVIPDNSNNPYLAPSSSATQTQASRPINPGTVPTYLWQSIVCLVCCCMPLAIPAIVFATKVEPALMSGNIAEAQRCSAEAKKWCWISFGLGLFGGIAYAILMVFAGMADSGF